MKLYIKFFFFFLNTLVGILSRWENLLWVSKVSNVTLSFWVSGKLS